MAERGRDVVIHVLADADRFDLNKPAQQLEDLGDTATDTSKDLDRLTVAAKDADTPLAEMARDAGKAEHDVDQLGTSARDAARKVDDAFDAISKSSHSNLRQKLDDDVDHGKAKLHEAGEEAQGTAREMFASFSNVDSITGAAQEIAANVPALFGPIGLAVGGLLSVGIAKFTQNAEKMKEKVEGFAAEMIEQNGLISDSFIEANLQTMALDGTLDKLDEKAGRAGVSADLLAQAVAGNTEAAHDLNAEIDDQIAKLEGASYATEEAKAASEAHVTALMAVKGEIGKSSRAYDQAREKINRFREATKKPITPKIDGEPIVSQATRIRAEVEDIMGEPIPVEINPYFNQNRALRMRAELQDRFRP